MICVRFRGNPHPNKVWSLHITHIHRQEHCWKPLLGGDLKGSVADEVNDIVGGLSVDGAANRLGSPEDLLNGSLKLLRHRPGAHDAGNFVDLLNGDVSIVLDWRKKQKSESIFFSCKRTAIH